MAEEHDTPGGEPGGGGQVGGGAGSRRIEGDLLSERRALRAAESGEAALVRRAEAAEATVETLERHVLSLQQRLGEVEEDRARLAELLEAERTVALEREHELRRVKQREYAEQQLRVEAEDRLTHVSAAGARLDRESRTDVERLAARLSASEDEARDLGDRLEALQRELAEAEQAAAAERASLRRSDADVDARLAALEARAAEIQRGLEAERAARERSEVLLEAMRDGHRRMETLVGDMKTLIAQLTRALTTREVAAEPSAASATAAPPPLSTASPEPPPMTSPARAGTPPEHAGQAPAAPVRLAPPAGGEQPRGEEMAEALAAAVERLRARAEAAPAPPAELQPPAPAHVPHKHSLSLIRRLRNRRKQRRSR